MQVELGTYQNNPFPMNWFICSLTDISAIEFSHAV